MANNNGIFNAAIQGGTSVIASRWQYNTSSAFYATQAARIVAFATQVDADIAADPTLSQADYDLMEAICSAWWDDRSTKVSVAGNYEPAASTIVAIWTQMRGNMLPPGAIPVPLDPGEVPKMLYDIAPGVIGYTEILWDEATQNSQHPIGVGAAFGSQPATSGGIRLSQESNGGTVTVRNNANDRDNLVLRAGGIGDPIIIGEIDPADPTNQVIDLIGESFDEGARPFYLRITQSDNIPLPTQAAVEGVSIQSLEMSLPDPNGGLNISTPAVIDSDHDGYGIGIWVGTVSTSDSGITGGALTIFSGGISAAVGDGESVNGGPFNIRSGDVSANEILGTYTSGEMNVATGNVERGVLGSGNFICEDVVIEGGDITPTLGSGSDAFGARITVGGAKSLFDDPDQEGTGGSIELLAGTGGTFSGGVNIIGANAGSGAEAGVVQMLHGVGSGGGIAGELQLGNFAVPDTIRINSSADGSVVGMGFFSTTPTTQLTSYPVFTDAGTPSGTNVLGDVGGAFNQANINNNFATCAVAFNDILDILETYGLTA